MDSIHVHMYIQYCTVGVKRTPYLQRDKHSEAEPPKRDASRQTQETENYTQVDYRGGRLWMLIRPTQLFSSMSYLVKLQYIKIEGIGMYYVR